MTPAKPALALEPSEYSPRFKLWTLDELAQLPPPTWTLAHYLTSGGLSVLYGQPGHGKTFLSLAWSLSIATNRSWLAHAVRWGPVVWVATEGGWGLAQRVQAWLDAQGEPTLHAALFVREPVNLLQESAVAALLKDLAHDLPAAAQPVLITFDTLHGSMAGADENDAGDMGKVIDSCRWISRETGAHVQLIHHTSKDAKWERGSGSLRGAADTMLKLEIEDTVLTLTADKQRDAALPAPRQLRLQPIGNSCTVEPLEGSAPIGVADGDVKLLQAIRSLEVNGEATVAQVLEVVKLPRASAYKSLAKLERLGRVTRRRGKVSLTVIGAAEPNVSETL